MKITIAERNIRVHAVVIVEDVIPTKRSDEVSNMSEFLDGDLLSVGQP